MKLYMLHTLSPTIIFEARGRGQGSVGTQRFAGVGEKELATMAGSGRQRKPGEAFGSRLEMMRSEGLKYDLRSWDAALRGQKWWPQVRKYIVSRSGEDAKFDFNALNSYLRSSKITPAAPATSAAAAPAAPARQAAGGPSPAMQVPPHGQYERVRGQKPQYVTAGGRRLPRA
jgi:hypothetical protein